MNTSILKLEATVIRPKDFDELDGLAASISFPVEYDDEAIGEALGDQDLMAYVVGELHDLVVRMHYIAAPILFPLSAALKSAWSLSSAKKPKASPMTSSWRLIRSCAGTTMILACLGL